MKTSDRQRAALLLVGWFAVHNHCVFLVVVGRHQAVVWSNSAIFGLTLCTIFISVTIRNSRHRAPHRIKSHLPQLHTLTRARIPCQSNVPLNTASYASRLVQAGLQQLRRRRWSRYSKYRRLQNNCTDSTNIVRSIWQEQDCHKPSIENDPDF